MYQGEKVLQQTNNGKKIENQKNINQQEKAQQKQLENTVNNTFPNFSFDEKQQFVDVFNLLKKEQTTLTPKQLFLKLREIYRLCKSNPKQTLKEIEKIAKNLKNDKKNSLQEKLAITIKNLQEKREINNKKEQKQTIKINIERKNFNQDAQKLKESYAKLDPKLRQVNPEKLNQTLKSLSPENQKKLQKAGINPQEYAQFLLTKEAIFASDQQTPETQDFLESLKNLESSLNLNTKNFPNTYQVNKEFLSENPDMLQYAKTAPELKSFENKLSRENLKSPEENFAFVEKFGDNRLKSLQEQVKTFFDEKKQLKSLTPEQENLFKNYRQSLVQLKTDISTTTSNILKASTTQAPITLLNSCLDRTSLQEQNLNQLREKQSNAVQIHSQNDQDIAKITGTINGMPISFFYNLSNPAASLETEDHFNFDPNRNELNIGHLEKTKLNLQLPTIENIRAIIEKNLTPEDLQELLNNAENPQDYMSKLTERIQEICEDSFSPSEEIKSRLCLHTEKNLTSQEFSSDFFPPHLQDQLHNPTIVNNDQNLKKLLILFDTSTEHMTAAELQSFRKTLKKLRNLTQDLDQIQKIADPVVKNQLLNIHHAMQNESTLGDWTKNMLDFFNLFVRGQITKEIAIDHRNHENRRLNLYDLETFLQVSNYDHALKETETQNLLSPQCSQKYSIYKERQSEQTTESEVATLEEQLNFAFETADFAYA